MSNVQSNFRAEDMLGVKKVEAKKPAPKKAPAPKVVKEEPAPVVVEETVTEAEAVVEETVVEETPEA